MPNFITRLLRSLGDLGITVDADQKVTVEGAVAILKALSVIASGVPVTITRDYAPDGPYIGLYVRRHSDSPANNDGIGIQLTVENDNNENIHLGNVRAILEDVSDGVEVGRLAFLVGTHITVTGMLELLALNTDGTLDIFGDLDMNGNIFTDYRTPPTEIDDGDSPYTFFSDDAILNCDTDGGAITANLPAGIVGEHHNPINVGTSGNDVTVNPDGAELLNGVNGPFTLHDGESFAWVYSATKGWR